MTQQETEDFRRVHLFYDGGVGRGDGRYICVRKREIGGIRRISYIKFHLTSRGCVIVDHLRPTLSKHTCVLTVVPPPVSLRLVRPAAPFDSHSGRNWSTTCWRTSAGRSSPS